MAVYLVTYDLIGEPRLYQRLYEYLARFPHCRPLESVWLIERNVTAVQIRDETKVLVDENDKIFVSRVFNDHRASWNLSDDCTRWLQSPQRQW